MAARHKRKHTHSAAVAGPPGTRSRALDDLLPPPAYKLKRSDAEGDTEPLCLQHDDQEEDALMSDPLDCCESIPGSTTKAMQHLDIANANQSESAAILAEEHLCHPDELLNGGIIGLSLEDLEMSSWMAQREVFYRPDPKYFSVSSVKPQMRVKVLDWLQHVSEDMKLRRETFHLAVNYFDRFLSNEKSADFVKSAQLVGVVALFVASKSEEIMAPQADAFIWQSANQFKKAQIFALEARMLSALKWFLLPKTAWSWLKLYVGKTVHLIQHLIDNRDDRTGHTYEELCSILEKVLRAENIYRVMELIDCALLHPDFLFYLPSQVAAASLMKVVPLQDLVGDITGFDRLKLAECSRWLEQFTYLESRYVEFRADNARLEIPEMLQKQPYHPNAQYMILNILAGSSVVKR